MKKIKKFDYDINISFDGDFSSVTTVNRFVKNEKQLWHEISPYDLFESDDGDMCGDVITLTNVDINGEKWEFTIEVTETEPSQDYSSYGKWYPTEILIMDKIKL